MCSKRIQNGTITYKKIMCFTLWLYLIPAKNQQQHKQFDYTFWGNEIFHFLMAHLLLTKVLLITIKQKWYLYWLLASRSTAGLLGIITLNCSFVLTQKNQKVKPDEKSTKILFISSRNPMSLRSGLLTCALRFEMNCYFLTLIFHRAVGFCSISVFLFLIAEIFYWEVLHFLHAPVALKGACALQIRCAFSNCNPAS